MFSFIWLIEFDPNYVDEEYDRVMDRVRDDQLLAMDDKPLASDEEDSEEKEEKNKTMIVQTARANYEGYSKREVLKAK